MWMLIVLGCTSSDAMSCQVYTRIDLLTYASETKCYEEAMDNYYGIMMAGKFKYARPFCVRAAGDAI